MAHEQTEYQKKSDTYWKWKIYRKPTAKKQISLTLEPTILSLLAEGQYITAIECDKDNSIGEKEIVIQGIQYRWANLEVLKRLKKVDKIVEIGVSYGNNAWRMCRSLRPKECHLVDPYVDTPENVVSKEDNADANVPFELAKHLLSTLPVNATFHKQPSNVAYKKFDDEYFDFIYIDGDHSYKAVKEDIELWYPKLRKGGIIAGDDYHKDGVKPAVEECFKNYEVSLNEYEWLVTKE